METRVLTTTAAMPTMYEYTCKLFKQAGVTLNDSDTEGYKSILIYMYIIYYIITERHVVM